MEINRRLIVQNSIFIYIGEIISKALLFLFNAIVARKLGVLEFGIFTFAYSFSLIIIGFIDFGTNNYIFKSVSEHKNKTLQYIKQILKIEVLLSVTATILLSLFLFSFNYTDTTRSIILILYFSLVFENLTSVYRNVLKGLEHFHLDAFVSVLSSVLRLIFSFSLFFFMDNVYGISIGVVFSTIAVLFVCFYFTKNILSKIQIIEPNEDKESILKLAKSCFIYAVPNIMKGIYLRIDAIVVKGLISGFDLGLYNSALKILYTQYFIPVSLIQVIFPTLNRFYYLKQNDSINKIFPKIYTGFFVILNFFQMLQVIFAYYIIDIIYGNEFIASVSVYQIITMSFVFTSLTALLNFLFIANNSVRKTNKYYIITIFVKVILIVLLSNKFGLLGAGVAFLICEISQFLIFLFGSFKSNIEFKQMYFILFSFFIFLDLILLSLNINNYLKVIALTFGSVFILTIYKFNLFKYTYLVFKELPRKIKD